MSTPTRREWIQSAGLLAPFSILAASKKKTDIRIEDVSISYEDYNYRVPIKFGGRVVDKATILNVNSVVRTADGRVVKGFGSMPLSNTWAFPSKTMPYEVTLGSMRELATRITGIMKGYKEFGHPIDIYLALEPQFVKAAAEVSTALKMKEPIPKLGVLVTASAFDATIHDAYGKAHKVNSYHTYGPEFMNYDLSHYVDASYKGEYPSRYIQKEPKPKMPLYHLVSAVDPIFAADIPNRLNDGLPETLAEWIHYNGLTHLKIKLNGDDPKWDVERVINVDRETTQVQRKRGVTHWVYSLDFNERCPSVEYLIQFLNDVKQKTPGGYARVQYVEQPTSRFLKEHPEQVMHAAGKLKPVVADESMTDIESMFLSRKMGYTGVALKACKGQSHSVILASVAEKNKMFLCVQDLTCPGASLIHSAGLSAHIPSVAGIEANARQYVPIANKGWDERFPGVFKVKDGNINTSGLNKPGLSAVA